MKYVALLICILIPVTAGAGNTITVGCDTCMFETIQAAVDSADYGETVLVFPDHSPYCENVVMRPGVCVYGTDPVNRPLLHCLDKQYPTVTFDHPDIGRETMLKYLIIVDGDAGLGAGIFVGSGASPRIYYNEICYQTGVFGAGIYVGPGCAPYLYKNHIHGNIADLFGGGIYVADSTSGFTLNNNEIHTNEAMDGAGVFCVNSKGLITSNSIYNNGPNGHIDTLFGGGMLLYFTTDQLTVKNNTFTGNKAEYGGGLVFMYTENTVNYRNTFNDHIQSDYGAGVYIESSTQTVSRSTFTSNTAGINGGAIMVNGNGGPVSISRCDIRTNTAGTHGGGIYADHNDQLQVVNCVLVENRAQISAGICLARSTSPVIINNTLYGFRETANKPMTAIYIQDDISADIVNNFIQDHVLGIFQEDPGNLSDSRFNRFFRNAIHEINCDFGPGDIAGIEPMYVDEGVDFHLRNGSTGHNQGFSVHPDCPDVDKDGLPRPMGTSIDIGAYERWD